MDVSTELNDEINKREEHDTAGAESQCELDNEIEELVVFTRKGNTQNLKNNISEDKVVLGSRRHEGDTLRKEHQKAVSREGMTRLLVNVPANIKAERGNEPSSVVKDKNSETIMQVEIQDVIDSDMESEMDCTDEDSGQ